MRHINNFKIKPFSGNRISFVCHEEKGKEDGNVCVSAGFYGGGKTFNENSSKRELSVILQKYQLYSGNLFP
jgi:hypothetical protein